MPLQHRCGNDIDRKSDDNDNDASKNQDKDDQYDQIRGNQNDVPPEEDSQQGRCNVYRNQGQSYNHLTNEDMNSHVCLFTMEQVVWRASQILENPPEGSTCMQAGLNVGLKKFGAQGKAANTKELFQLHNLECYFPVHGKYLTPKQWKKESGLLILLKEKWDGAIKSKSCTDGRPQHAELKKEEAASPNVSIEAVFFLTTIINAMEGRDVAVVYVPGAMQKMTLLCKLSWKALLQIWWLRWHLRFTAIILWWTQEVSQFCM